jgi:hypothetical protein
MYRFTTTTEIASQTYPDLCFAYYAHEAVAYGRGPRLQTSEAGYLHTAKVSNWDRIASWDEALEVWEAAGLVVGSSEPMIYADSAKFRQALADAGFGGMIYDDAGPLNAYEHETVRVWDMTLLTVTGCTPVTVDEVDAAWDRACGA